MAFELTEQIRRHLEQDRTIVLTTVSPTGRPLPRPVWFLFQDGQFVVFSEPDKPKLRHIEANSHVTLSTNVGSGGGDFVAISGTARIADGPNAEQIPSYVERYGSSIIRLGLTNATFAAKYSVPIHIRPTGAWTIPGG